MDRIRWIIFAVVCVGILGFLVATSGSNTPDVSNLNENDVINEGPIPDRVYGNRDAATVLIEYGDFQCPGCASAFPSVKTVKERYDDNLAFVFRHLPLTSIHPNALAAATAAEAAGQQGKFFEMHDLLYQNQTAWQSASAESRGELFEDYARQLGLNLEKYREDLTSDAVQQKIARDRALARKHQAEATPTFILEGTKLNDDQWNTLEALDATVRSALQRNGVTLPSEEAEPAPPPAE